MYGLVNDGIREFIVKSHGEDVWRAICADAGAVPETFELMMTYDDAVTYDLVGAISRHLKMEPAIVLEVFGRFWPGYAGNSSVGKLIRFGGRSFLELLESLDEMHERITLAMPHLKPPSFELEPMDEGTYRLHYYSDRKGLAPMVIGLIQGAAAHHNTEIEISHALDRAAGDDHDAFDIVLVASDTGAIPVR